MKVFKRVCIITLLASVLVSTGVYLDVELKDAIAVFARTKGNAMLSWELQNELYSILSSKENEYLTVYRDSDNRISSIDIHSDKITLLASEMTISLLNHLHDYKSYSFGVPLGNLTSIVFFSGKGPVIPITPCVSGNVANQILSSFQSAGINQTLHKIVIRFIVAIEYLAPVETYSDTISFDIVVAETLIVGEVPIIRE